MAKKFGKFLAFTAIVGAACGAVYYVLGNKKDQSFDPDDNGSSLKKVELCEGVLALGDLAFDGCYYLTTIELPSTLLSIGNNPFANSGIRSVINNSDKFAVENYCIYRKWSFKLISYFGADQNVSFDKLLVEIRDYAFSGNTSLLQITIPKDVRHIGDYAFYNCRNLQHIEMPESIISIGKNAFNGCSS